MGWGWSSLLGDQELPLGPVVRPLHSEPGADGSSDASPGPAPSLCPQAEPVRFQARARAQTGCQPEPGPGADGAHVSDLSDRARGRQGGGGRGLLVRATPVTDPVPRLAQCCLCLEQLTVLLSRLWRPLGLLNLRYRPTGSGWVMEYGSPRPLPPLPEHGPGHLLHPNPATWPLLVFPETPSAHREATLLEVGPVLQDVRKTGNAKRHPAEVKSNI